MARCDQTNIPTVNNTGVECTEFVNDVCVNFPLANSYLGLPADSSLRDTLARIQRVIQANQRLINNYTDGLTYLEALELALNVDSVTSTIQVLSPYSIQGYLQSLFAQTSSVTVANTITESTIVGSGVGTLSVPADGFKVGDSFTCKVGGEMSANNGDTIQIQIKSGAVILADSGAITLPAITNKFWEIEIDFTIRAVGAATIASIISNGQFTYNKNASNAYEGQGFNSTNTTTFDTTVINTLDVTVTWGTADPNNSITSDVLVLNKTY